MNIKIPDDLRRYETAAARRRLAEEFELPDRPEMQDWSFEASCPERVDEFLERYQDLEMDGNERHTLIMLILASLEEADDYDGSEHWEKIVGIIREDWRDLAGAVRYWARPACGPGEGPFRITPLILPHWDWISERIRTQL